MEILIFYILLRPSAATHSFSPNLWHKYVLLLLEDSEAEGSGFRRVTSGSGLASVWDSF